MALSFVHRHVEDAKVQLAEVEQRVVDVLGADQVLDDFVGNALGRLGLAVGLLLPGGKVLRGQGRVVLAQGLELGRCPAPVLQHLTGSFNKVPDSAGPVEARVDRPGDEVVDSVSKLMEQSHHLVVLEETRFLGRGLGEIAHQCSGRVAPLAVSVDEALTIVSRVI